MRWIRGLLDRILLIGAVIVGGLVPGFIAQYRQRLGGRLDQARLDLAPWQKIADQFFGGDLHKLIQYHLASSTPPIHAEGAVIRHLALTVRELQAQMAALHGNLYHQVVYLALHPNPDLVRATLTDWVPTFGLSAQALVFAAVFAVLLWLLFQGSWAVTAAGGRHLARHLRKPPPATPPPPSPTGT